MLQRLDSFKGLTLHALDGELGRVNDFQFDDDRWTVRYLVARTEPWLGRNVLISPISIDKADWVEGTLSVRLTRDQIRNSPEVPLMRPFGREAEVDFMTYYGYADYWGGPSAWGWAGLPGPLAGPPPADYVPTPSERVAFGMVRSVHALQGMHIHARDGEIGHVDDVFIDEESWRIRYLLVDTSNWIGGRHVLVPTDNIDGVDWTRERLDVDLSRGQIEQAPQYDPSRPLDRVVEDELERYYNLAPPPRTRSASTR